MDNNQLKETISYRIEEVKGKVDTKNAKRLNLNLLVRIVNRLLFFSDNCGECTNYLQGLKPYVDKLYETSGLMEKSDSKDYNRYISSITSHLQKSHKLVTEGYYTGVYMVLGMTIGMPFGYLLGNIAIGLPIGMCIGLAIGSGLDADAKKKNLVI